MYYIIYMIIIGGIGFFCKEKIITTCESLSSLTKAVAKRHKGPRAVICNTIDVLRKKFWFDFVQRINNSITRLDKNTSVMTYTLDGRLYKMVLEHRKGPSLVLLVSDENGDDITTEVVPFLGPKRDWHKREFTPKFWNKETLEFELSNGENKEFRNDDVIKLL